jgi:hypothetical protein
MGFIKRGDGKILSVVEPEAVPEEQKKVAQDLVKKEKETKESTTKKIEQ